jgi:cytochrome c oxidase cbb3-type subunit I
MLEFADKRGSSALAWMVAGACFFVLGTFYGLFSAIHLVAPEFFNNIPWFVFSRARPIHINTVLYGFVVSVLTGAAYWYLPAVLKTRLWSERMGWASLFCWVLVILSGPATFSFGITQGREYSEYTWPADVLLMISVTLTVVNFIMTVANRVENTLYVSVWYAVATFLWTAGTYPIGNVMWHPRTGAMPGLIDDIFLWFYGHNLPGLFLTPLAVGAAYYVIPRVARAPLFSHPLSLLGFWSLVVLYTHIGGHHLLQAPIPNWLKFVSVADSLAMVVPVFAALTNLWMTARGKAGRLLADPAARFVMAGTWWYLITCLQGPFQSIPAIQRVTHFNNWTIGHAHIAVLGFSGYVALGAMWHILPAIVRKQIYSKRLVNLQFGLVTVGLTGFFVVLTIAGLIQGEAWNNGETVYRTIPMIMPYMVTRAALGIFIISSAIVGLYNLVMTIRHGEPLPPMTAAQVQEEASV